MLIAGLLTMLSLTDPEGVVATAPSNTPDLAAALAAPAAVSAPAPTAQDATPHGLTTEQQIQRWVDSRTPGASFDEAAVAGPADDREVHGMVEAGIGTGGYRSYGAAVSLPVGENGRLDLAYREGRNDVYGWGSPGYVYPSYGGWGSRRGLDGNSRSMSMGFSWSKDRDGDNWRDRPPVSALD